MIRLARTSRMGRAYGDLESVPPELLTASHAASNAETRILISSGSNDDLFNMGVINTASPLPLIPVCAFTAERFAVTPCPAAWRRQQLSIAPRRGSIALRSIAAWGHSRNRCRPVPDPLGPSPQSNWRDPPPTKADENTAARARHDHPCDMREPRRRRM
jgi:hypothetical protein